MQAWPGRAREIGRVLEEDRDKYDLHLKSSLDFFKLVNRRAVPSAGWRNCFRKRVNYPIPGTTPYYIQYVFGSPFFQEVEIKYLRYVNQIIYNQFRLPCPKSWSFDKPVMFQCHPTQTTTKKLLLQCLCIVRSHNTHSVWEGNETWRCWSSSRDQRWHRAMGRQLGKSALRRW